MSYFLRVLCRSNAALAIEDVESFICDGVFFDADPEFTTGPTKNSQPDWELEVRYDTERRPILIYNSETGANVNEEQSDIRAEVSDRIPSKFAQEFFNRLATTKRVIAMEIDRDGLTEAAWQMLDCLQADFASRYDGIVYAPDDGIFDARLRRLAKLAPN